MVSQGSSNSQALVVAVQVWVVQVSPDRQPALLVHEFMLALHMLAHSASSASGLQGLSVTEQRAIAQSQLSWLSPPALS